MASTIGTNVVPDEQQYIHVMETIMNGLEKLYMKDDENKKRMKLMEELRNHVKMGKQIAYNVIPSQYKDKVIEMLEDQNIPYMAAPDGNGHTMVIVKDSDKDKLLEIQKDIELLSTDYVKELTPQNMLMLYKAHGIKNVDTLTFNDKEMAEIAKQKLYQSGVTFAEVENKEETELIISPMSKFSKDGNDLSLFELHHAFEQSKADSMFKKSPDEKCTDFLATRFKQGAYDREQLDKFASAIKDGKSCVLCSGKGKQEISIESNAMGVFVLERTKDSKAWKSTQLTIGDNASVKDISALLSKYSDKITDMTIISKTLFDKIKDENISKDDPRLASASKRPENDVISREVKRYATISKDLDNIIIEVNKEATRRVNTSIGNSIVSQEKSYQMKKDEILKILQSEDLGIIHDFLNSSTMGISSEEKTEWYHNIVHHYEDTHENTDYSCDLNKTTLKDFATKLSKSMDFTNEKFANMDKKSDLGMEVNFESEE